MRDFSDKPYRYFPPRRSPVAAWVLGLYNRYIYLPKTMRISAVQVSGHTAELTQHRGDDRLLFVPNHPTHCDAQIYLEALRQIGISTHIMAAYDVFLRNERTAWIMQRLGAFSVDREGSDAKAMKQALATLADGRHALTIFPEGNVYLQNDTVTPFHEGAAFIGLRSAKALAEKGARVQAVPVSIKVTHVRDIREKLSATLHKLSEAMVTELDPEASPLEKVRQVGRAALLRNLRQRGIEPPGTETLANLIQQASDSVIRRLEQKMGLQARTKDSLIERIRRARRAIHEIRLDEKRNHDHTVAGCWADEAMLALRIATYSVGYVESNPTIDRFAETIEKLAEDIYVGAQEPFSMRLAFVHFGSPIDLSDYSEMFKRKSRVAVHELTESCERSVQQGLDHLNANNPHPGARLWEGASD